MRRNKPVDMANPEDSKSVVYLSHEVQKVKLQIRWQVAQGVEACIKVSFISFHFQIFTVL